MVSVTHSFVSEIEDGEDDTLVRPSDWNAEHVLDGLTTAPAGFIGAKAYNDANQSVNNSVVLFNSEQWDTDGFHSTSSQTSRFTIPAGLGGKYLLIGQGQDQTGTCTWLFSKNGSGILGAEVLSAQFEPTNMSTVVDLVAGDYVELFASTGGSHTIYGDATPAAQVASMSIVKLDSGKVGAGIGAKVYHSADVTKGTASFAPTAFNTELFDTDGFHDTVTNNSRLTIPAGLAGKYLVGARAVWASNSTGVRYLQILKNASVVHEIAEAPASGDETRQETSTVLDLAVGDFLTTQMAQNSGGDLTLEGGSGSGGFPAFWLMRLDSGSSPEVRSIAATVSTAGQTITSTSPSNAVMGAAPAVGTVVMVLTGCAANVLVTPTATNIAFTNLLDVSNATARVTLWRGIVSASASATIVCTRASGSAFYWGYAQTFSGISGTLAASATKQHAGATLATSGIDPTSNALIMSGATATTGGTDNMVSPFFDANKGLVTNFAFAGYRLGHMPGNPVGGLVSHDTSSGTALLIAAIT